MDDLQIGLYPFLGVVELVLVLLVVAVIFIVRNRSLSARVRGLQGQLKKAADQPEPVSFAQYLRDEVLRNQDLYERASASTEQNDKDAADLLALRRQFLELELAARELENNPVRFQQALAEGLGELREKWRPEGETVEAPAADEPPAPAGELEEATDDEPETAARATLDTHEEEFDRLKRVILNQQDAMAALRTELQAREADIQDLDSILRKLDEFEQHDGELQQCLKVLEQENQRLKQANSAGGRAGGRGTEIKAMDPAQLTGLKNMIGNQQETITNLQQLIQELAPEASKAAELQAAIENIQRANQELNGCVAVLEDENAMLRAELDAVNAQLEYQEALAAAAAAEPDLAVMDDSETDPKFEEATDDEEAGLSPDEEREQLEIKVQELEALVEFKDAAIEELEKQYNTLESKYLALTGEKK